MILCVIIKSLSLELKAATESTQSFLTGWVIESFGSGGQTLDWRLRTNPNPFLVLYHDTLCHHQISQPKLEGHRYSPQSFPMGLVIESFISSLGAQPLDWMLRTCSGGLKP